MTRPADLPLPPLEFRHLVGPNEAAAFDNPLALPVFAEVPRQVYASVLDFGCGCGRIARRLIQQEPAPGRYLGLDPHHGMIDWCRQHLAPHAPGFEFRHHDVFQEFMNPYGSLEPVPLPIVDHDVTLFIAWAVFTHLLPADAEFYLREMARVLSPDGVAITTWFLFDKSDFPMMQKSQNALYISDFDPTNAVIFDRTWLSAAFSRAGLEIAQLTPPMQPGSQWTMQLRRGEGTTSLLDLLTMAANGQPASRYATGGRGFDEVARHY